MNLLTAIHPWILIRYKAELQLYDILPIKQEVGGDGGGRCCRMVGRQNIPKKWNIALEFYGDSHKTWPY